MKKSVSPKAGTSRRGFGLESLEARQLLFNIQLDYSYDSGGFFGDASRKATLQAAANFLSAKINDTLSAIVPSGGNSWTASFYQPDTGNVVSVNNVNVPADTVIVYVGGRLLDGGTLGEGGPGGYNAVGSTSWVNTVSTRGEGTVEGSSANDVAPQVGSIAFDTDSPWSFGTTTSSLASGKYDFYSVAMHELGHVLGVGTSDSWSNLSTGGSFRGTKTVAYYGGPVATSVAYGDGGAHLGENVTDPDSGQEAAMDPNIGDNERKAFTKLDFTVLDDIGYDISYSNTPTPTPGSGSVSGVVFYDTDNDGVKDAGESGAKNVLVYLDADRDGVFDANEVSAYTDAAGNYFFSNLVAGTYRVRQGTLAGYNVTHPSAKYADVTVPSGGGSLVGPSFGNVSTAPVTPTPGTVSGSVFNDKDADGVKDSGEAYLSGWRVFADKDGDGVYDSGEPSTTTNSKGSFTLSLAGGNYRVYVSRPGGYRSTAPKLGYADFAVRAGVSAGSVQFGVTQNVLISGTVYYDKDASGSKTKKEVGLAGWGVYIDTNNNGKWDKTEASTYTDANGNFSFATLSGTKFIVRVIQQGKYALTAPSAKSYTFTLTGGGTKSGLLFGEKLT
jgi:hypothetical protein